MPRIRYKCTGCGREMEILFRRFNFPDSFICEECESVMTRQYGSVGIQFKGDGYYVNDTNKSGGVASDDKSD